MDLEAPLRQVSEDLDWLASLPAHWAVERVSNRAWISIGWTPPTSDDSNFDGDNLWANISDLSERYIRDTARRVSDEAVHVARARAAPAGSLLFSFKLSVGAVSFPTVPMYTNEAIAAFTPRRELEMRYAYYAFPIYILRNAGENIYGAPILNQTRLAQAKVAFPPIEEQRVIADYLDRETAQIDAFIAKNEELITLLAERRASSIVDLIGDHETIPLKRVVSSKRPLTYGILQCGEPVENGIPYIGPSDLPGEGASPALESLRRTTPEIAAAYGRSVLEGGDIVVSIGPAFGRVGLISDDLAGANLTQDTVRVATMPEKINVQYLVWVLSSRIADDFWDYEILGATFRRLNLGTLGETPIPYPSIAEQQRIAGEVAEAVAKIDKAIDVANRTVELARERRAALISAAVTGKIGWR